MTDEVGHRIAPAPGSPGVGMVAFPRMIQGDEDLESLLSGVIQKDRAFEGFGDLCARVSGYYISGQLRPDPLSPQAQEEMSNSLSQAQELIAKIEEEIS